MKIQITVFLILFSFLHTFGQIQTDYNWGASAKNTIDDNSSLLVSQSESLVKFKTKILDQSAICEYYFKEDKLTKVQYTLINSNESLLSIWETFQEFDNSISYVFNETKKEDVTQRKLIENDTKVQMKKISRGVLKHNIEWEDSIIKCELVLFGYAMNPRMILVFTPQKEVLNKSFLNESAFEESKQKESGKTLISNKKITVKRGFGKSYYYKDRKLNKLELFDVTLNIPIAGDMMNRSRNSETIGAVLGAIGGAMFGYNLGQAFTISSHDFNPTLGLIGLAIIGTSITFDIAGDKRRYKAVRLYNSLVK